MKEKERKLIFISDLHVGGDMVGDDFACEDELISFLDYLEKTNDDLELIILGDFLDLWKVELHPDEQVEQIIKDREKLFKRFKKFAKKFKVTVIPGNHDHALVYNKKYQQQLANYNIEVNSDQYFKREFSKGDKVFRIIGEHGNQVEPACAFPDFKMPTDSSLSYHVAKQIIYRVMEKKDKKNSPIWVKYLDKIEIDLIPYWVISKYFYYELGPFFKSVIIPMLILFSFAVPYFVFDVITIFYRPSFLLPILSFLETNIFMRVIIFILYFDMVIVIILFFLSFIKKDFKKKLQDYYGLQSLSDIVLSRENAYHQNAIEVLSGANPYDKKADMYINGHTHNACLNDTIIKEKLYVDTGSWKQLMKRISARFSFPPIYAPYYSLTYVVCSKEDDMVKVQLRERPKEFVSDLTFLEHSAVKKRKEIPKSVNKDILISEAVLPIK